MKHVARNAFFGNLLCNNVSKIAKSMLSLARKQHCLQSGKAGPSPVMQKKDLVVCTVTNLSYHVTVSLNITGLCVHAGLQSCSRFSSYARCDLV